MALGGDPLQCSLRIQRSRIVSCTTEGGRGRPRRRLAQNGALFCFVERVRATLLSVPAIIQLQPVPLHKLVCPVPCLGRAGFLDMQPYIRSCLGG